MSSPPRRTERNAHLSNAAIAQLHALSQSRYRCRQLQIRASDLQAAAIRASGHFTQAVQQLSQAKLSYDSLTHQSFSRRSPEMEQTARARVDEWNQEVARKRNMSVEAERRYQAAQREYVSAQGEVDRMERDLVRRGYGDAIRNGGA